MVRERDRATIENKLKALRATLVTAGHEGGVEAVLDAIVDRERAQPMRIPIDWRMTRLPQAACP